MNLGSGTTAVVVLRRGSQRHASGNSPARPCGTCRSCAAAHAARAGGVRCIRALRLPKDVDEIGAARGCAHSDRQSEECSCRSDDSRARIGADTR